MLTLRRLAAFAAATISFTAPSPAQAYPIDCAILLCLAGGWPASAECAQAKAVFIARITPFPIEPPLQIWNCPMRVGFRGSSGSAMSWEPLLATARSSEDVVTLVQGEQADMDISDPIFDFVRSIQVFHIQYVQRRESRDSCSSSVAISKGVYGLQGNFRWIGSSLNDVPLASKVKRGTNCGNYSYKAVFMDWRDQAGRYDSVEVRY
ncbi:MAG: hypothetical protein DI533_17085 [Cereibacter sphaeroides]|uniref:Uncharacterized protein n=1 Tax=Cereibacter sphaeroides TaxID=1063 RepID=A0A2W5RZP4_CERSP|nr:MAG: hypothetical protein DI533_17085 [Cereibacter sphaeroides]